MASEPEVPVTESTLTVVGADANALTPQSVPKKRGRPKKTAAKVGETLISAASETEEAAATTNGVENAPQSPEVKPKKRGRQKKTEAAAATNNAEVGQPEGTPQPTQAVPKKRGRPRKTPEKVKEAGEGEVKAKVKAVRKPKQQSKEVPAGDSAPAEAADASKSATVGVEKGGATAAPAAAVAAAVAADAADAVTSKEAGKPAGRKRGRKPAAGSESGVKDASGQLDGTLGAKEGEDTQADGGATVNAPAQVNTAQDPAEGETADGGKENAEGKKRIRGKKRGAGKKKEEGATPAETTAGDGGKKDGEGVKGGGEVKDGEPAVGGGSESARKRRRQVQAQERKRAKKGKEEVLIFSEADREALVLLVRHAQKKGMEGSQGNWHGFLEKKGAGQLKDPARLPWQTLAEFAGTLPKEETAQLVPSMRVFCQAQKQRGNMTPCKHPAVQALVQMTRSHPKFLSQFSFPSYEPGWIITDAATGAERDGKGAKSKGKKPDGVEHVKGTDAGVAVAVAVTGGDEDEAEGGGEGGGKASKRQKVSSDAPPAVEGQEEEEEESGDDMIGIDCEMCQSVAGPEESAGKVPRSTAAGVNGGAGAGGHAVTTAELMRICVVNRKGKVLLDKLVRPKRHVTSYLTTLTGLQAKDFEGVSFSFEDAQRAVASLIKPSTIVVGHSLKCDLEVLKIDHPRVIDTSLIFQYSGIPDATPPLALVALRVLGLRMRRNGFHECTEDAEVPLTLVKHLMKAYPQPPPKIRPITVQLSESDLSKLQVDRLPRGTSVFELREVFAFTTGLMPVVQAIKFAKSYGSATVTFNSSTDCNRAFDMMQGTMIEDVLKRSAKNVSGPGQSHLQKGFVIRKLAGENGQLSGAHPEMLERMGMKGYTVIGESEDVMSSLKAEGAVTDASDVTTTTTPLKLPPGQVDAAEKQSGVEKVDASLALVERNAGGSILGVPPTVVSTVGASESVNVGEVMEENERLRKALSEKEAEVAALQRLLLQTVSMNAKS